MKNGLFVTGTDTGVGKTLVSALLLRALRSAGARVGYFKPTQTGDDDDTTTVRRLAGLADDEILEPAYRFAAPAAPSRAARLEGKEVSIDRILARWGERAADRVWVAEGAGGLLVPLTPTRMIRDLVRALELPQLIVARTRLGTINHTLLTIEATRAAGIELAGVVLSGEPDPGLAETIEAASGARIVAEIPWLPEAGAEDLDRAAARLAPFLRDRGLA